MSSDDGVLPVDTGIEVEDGEEEEVDEESLVDFLMDISERDDVPDDVRDEAAGWALHISEDAPDADAEAEEGQEPG